MNKKEKEEYKKETGKSPFYDNLLTDDYKKWLNQKDMQKAIQRVIAEEEKEKGDMNGTCL